MRSTLPHLRFKLAAVPLILVALITGFLAGPSPANAVDKAAVPAAASDATAVTRTSVTVDADGTRVETKCTNGICARVGTLPPSGGQTTAKSQMLDVEPNATGWPTSGTIFRTLQLNLCNSGAADCYAGGASITEAVEMIKVRVPDLVTINEICYNDISNLAIALSRVSTGYHISWMFQAAVDDRTNLGYKCENGYDYGIMVLGRVPKTSYTSTDSWSGRYTSQTTDPDIHEERVFACMVMVNNYFGCTTHLAANEPAIAMNQCHELMDTYVPQMKSWFPGLTAVVGGDLNLKYDTSSEHNVQSCVPAGWFRKGDGDVQHVMAESIRFTFVSTTTYSMVNTDHPAFFVRYLRK